MATLLDKIYWALGEGARSTKFDIEFYHNETKITNKNAGILCKTASVPNRQLNPIPIKYKGREVYIPGQTKYTGTYDCEFYCTEDHNIRDYFEKWQQSIEMRSSVVVFNPDADKAALNSLNGLETITVYQIKNDSLDLKDKTKKYTLYGVYPLEISAMNYDSSGPGNVLTFTVTFQYTYYTVKDA
jgi:hypothetical protein